MARLSLGLLAAGLMLLAPIARASDLSAVAPGADFVAPSGVIAEQPLHIEVRDVLPPIATIDLTTPPEDLWERMRNGFSMPDLDSELVVERQAWILSRPEYLNRIAERSRRYLHHIVEEIEKRGLPMELALLPMVESAFDPMAYSAAHASGLWQFIPATGRSYNLAQNWWIDQRRDIIASTGAALDYLQATYEMHGDWHLALASYNWGENAVARAIARNEAQGLPTDYASLSMPAETRHYVPKLQALKNIIARPQQFGISLPFIANRPYFATVQKPAGMDVALAAQLAETPLEEFKALNPSYNRPVMPGAAEQPLVLPADKVDVFLSNLENHDEPLTTWTTYSLKRGEKLESVARRYGISAARLREVNGIPARARLRPGHSLLVPAREAASPAKQVAPKATVSKARASRVKAQAPDKKATAKVRRDSTTRQAHGTRPTREARAPAARAVRLARD